MATEIGVVVDCATCSISTCMNGKTDMMGQPCYKS